MLEESFYIVAAKECTTFSKFKSLNWVGGHGSNGKAPVKQA
jgi:hypothetical protein